MTDSEKVDIAFRHASKCSNRDVLLQETIIALMENLSGRYDATNMTYDKAPHLYHFVRYKKANVWSEDSPTLIDMGTTCYHDWVSIRLGGIWLGDVAICEKSHLLFWRKAGMV